MINFNFELSNNIIYGNITLPESRYLVSQAYCIESVREGDLDIYVDVSSYSSDDIRLIRMHEEEAIVLELNIDGLGCTYPLLVDLRSNCRAKEVLEMFDYLVKSWRGEYMVPIENKTARMEEIEEEFAEPLGIEIEELFRKLYVDDNLSVEEMANMLGLGRATVVRWLERMNINARKLEFRDI